MVGSHALRLFGERVFPVCSPKLMKDSSRPLREPADLRHHALLHSGPPQNNTFERKVPLVTAPAHEYVLRI